MKQEQNLTFKAAKGTEIRGTDASLCPDYSCLPDALRPKGRVGAVGQSYLLVLAAYRKRNPFHSREHRGQTSTIGTSPCGTFPAPGKQLYKSSGGEETCHTGTSVDSMQV